MKSIFQNNNLESALPIKMIMHSVDHFQMHFHPEMEIIMVLEGSVKVSLKDKTYLLDENDFILVNSFQLHSTSKTEDKNILLAFQVNADFFNTTLSGFSDLEFDCNTLNKKHSEKDLNLIRTFMANIVWELNKKELGHKMKIISNLYLFANHLLNNFEYLKTEKDKKIKEDEITRIKRITKYIKENFKEKITLDELAKKEDLNYHYLSRFINDKLGISFQEYLNKLRLEEAARLLLTTNKSITEISNCSGFANINSFLNVFKEEYDTTPSVYREKEIKRSKVNNKIVKSYLDIDRSQALKQLFYYLEDKEVYKNFSKKEVISEKHKIDINQKAENLNKPWQKTSSFSRAKEGLNAEWQKHLKILQKDIGFEYIRFHGIFSDEMMVCNLINDEIVYNWTYVNQLLDFLIEEELKPFFDLTFMPSELKSSDKTVFWWEGNISMPKDIKMWNDLVKSFVQHCINRYGLSEVESWRFEVWNEPELTEAFFDGNQEDYHFLYKNTANTIKSISSNLKVGGPSITHDSILIGSWLEDFLDFIVEENIPLDFVSVHIFPEYIATNDLIKAKSFIEKEKDLSGIFDKVKKVYHHKNHISDTLKKLNNIIKNHLPKKVEIHVTEFNSSSEFKNLIHDTAYVSTFIVKSAIASINKVDSLVYWTFSDLIEEHRLGISHFHGGFGLMNKDGLKKASYNAFILLSKLGNQLIEVNKNYIVTKSEGEIQIIAFNYTHFDDLFLKGENSHISRLNRYEIYENKKELNLEMQLNLKPGEYTIAHYKLNKEHGSVYDSWAKLGGPENMGTSAINYLKNRSAMKRQAETISIKNNFKYLFSLPALGVEMLIIKKNN